MRFTYESDTYVQNGYCCEIVVDYQPVATSEDEAYGEIEFIYNETLKQDIPVKDMDANELEWLQRQIDDEACNNAWEVWQEQQIARADFLRDE